MKPAGERWLFLNSFLLPWEPRLELLLTSAHGAVAEGAAGEVLGVVGRGVLVLRVTSRRSRERRLVLVVMGGRGGDHGDVSGPDLIQHQTHT